MTLKKFFLLVAVISSIVPAGWIACEKTMRPKEDVVAINKIDIVARRNLDSLVIAMGSIKPKKGAEISVGSRASGIINRIWVEVGDVVSKGDTLAEIDKSEYEAVYKQWQAAMNSSDADFQYSSLVFKRQKELFDSSLVSVQDKDLAEKAQIVADYARKQAEANLETAKVRMEYTKIIAPISGVVASILIDEGETVAASFLAPTILTIIDLEKLELWAYVDEADVGRIKQGQRVKFFMNSYPVFECQGEVLIIHPKAEIIEDKVKFTCVIKIIEKRRLTLTPEMTATVKFRTEAVNNVLTVPNWAIGLEDRRPYVTVLKGNKRIKKWIRAGWKDDNFIEIMEGLSEGDTVTVSEEKSTKKAN